MNTYTKYKPSGIEWIGDVPKHWESIRLKFIGYLYGGLSGKNANDFNQQEGINSKYFIPFTNIAHNKIINPNDLQKVIIHENENQNKVKKDDLFFMMSSENYDDVGKSTVLSVTLIDVYLNSFCKGFRITNKNYSSIFLNYLLLSNAYRSRLLIEANGYTRINLKIEKINDFIINVPPLPEQQSIANFLDHKTFLIDAAITKKQQLIELLKEERTALINHAVTKGINPDLKLKPSGIEWLGDIPEHWVLTKFKNILKIPITDGPHTTPEILDTGIPFISAEAIKNGKIDFEKKRGFISERDYEIFSKKYTPEIKDIYMIKSGATTGNVAMVETNDKFNIWSPLAVFRANENKVLPEYLHYYLQSQSIRNAVELSWSFGTQQNIGMNVLSNLAIPYPSILEQKDIIDFISKSTQDFNKIADQIACLISKLKEYRTSLINEAVTGKICVV